MEPRPGRQFFPATMSRTAAMLEGRVKSRLGKDTWVRIHKRVVPVQTITKKDDAIKTSVVLEPLFFIMTNPVMHRYIRVPRHGRQFWHLKRSFFGRWETRVLALISTAFPTGARRPDCQGEQTVLPAFQAAHLQALFFEV